MFLRRWRRRKRLEREARRLLFEALRSPAVLAGTSLKLRHANRCVVVGHDEVGDRIVRVRFGILRHPRPYAFSRQFHNVIEYYVYHVEERRLERVEGMNLTRGEGKDHD